MANEFFSLALDAASGIATLEFNRPERLNTVAPGFFSVLRDEVQQLSDDGRTRVLVMRSTGKHFCAGMALEVFASGMPMLDTSSARQRLAFQDSLRRLMACIDVLDEARFPVICAVQGGCVGAGLDLAAACDIRICSADAFFTVQEIHIGMAADVGSLQRLPKIVPEGVARQMAYTGERLGAERALAVGLVNAVLPDAAALHAHADALARQISAKSPLAIAGSKRALNFARDHGTADALAQMTLLQSAIFDIDEMATAIAAWQAKGEAAFEPLAAVMPVAPAAGGKHAERPQIASDQPAGAPRRDHRPQDGQPKKGLMDDALKDFRPQDPGRVHIDDPLEVRWWCRELHCSEAELEAAVADVGERLTALHEHFARRR